MKTSDIERYLLLDLSERQFMCFTTNFQRNLFHECDVFGITKAGLIYVYEIKVSRSDFKNEFKKPSKIYKHQSYDKKINNIQEDMYIGWENKIHHPNYFYYVCPTGIIKPEEVQNHAGLIYVEKRIAKWDRIIRGHEVLSKDYGYFTTIKKAPMLHKQKADQQLYEQACLSVSNKYLFHVVDRSWKHNHWMEDNYEI